MRRTDTSSSRSRRPSRALRERITPGFLMLFATIWSACARTPAAQPASPPAPADMTTTSSPPPEPLPDPLVGAWEWSVEVDLQAFTGTLTLSPADSGYRGRFRMEGMFDSAAQLIRTAGDSVVLRVENTPQGEATMFGTVSRDRMAGVFVLTRGGEFPFTAIRRPD